MALIEMEDGRVVCTDCTDVADYDPEPGHGYRCPNCSLCEHCDLSVNGGCECSAFGWHASDTQPFAPTAVEWAAARVVIERMDLYRHLSLSFYEAELDLAVVAAMRASRQL